MDDLVDKEIISLLSVCKRLYMPTLAAIKNKMINFGPQPA